MSQANWDVVVQGFEQAREQFFASLGNTELKITPIITYAHKGFPAWPVRDGWQIIQRPQSSMIFSDGLSDPYMNGDPAIGLEVVVETASRLPDFDSVLRSWAYELVFQASFFVAGNPALRSSLEGKRSTTIEFWHVRAPSLYLTERGSIGALLTFGGHNIPDRLNLPGGQALVLVVTPLFPRELAATTGENRSAAIDTILSELQRRGYYHFCHDARDPVV